MLNTVQYRHCAICNKELNADRKHWETVELQFAIIFVCSPRCNHRFTQRLKEKPLRVYRYSYQLIERDNKTKKVKDFVKSFEKLGEKLIPTTSVKDLGILEVIN